MERDRIELPQLLARDLQSLGLTYAQPLQVEGGGIEPPTRGFSGHCSTD